VSVPNDGFVQRLDIEPTGGGILDGLTFGVKDLIDVAGTVTGCGNPTWAAEQVPAVVHAVAVEVLLGSGARCAGKTVTDEFAFSLVGENDFYGTPENPRAPGRIPGGSSSGSASAVAAGLVDFALGTDTAGSVRVPAANCGIVGLRPTWGRLAMAGIQPLAPSFDTLGFLARDAGVLAKVQDCYWPPERESREIKRVLMLREAWELADPEIQVARELITSQLRQAGLEVETIGLASLAEGELAEDMMAWKRVFSDAQWPEVWSTYGSWISAHGSIMGEKIAQNFTNVRTADRTHLAEASRRREETRQRVRAFLTQGIAIGLPTIPCPPPWRGEVDYDRLGSGYLPRTICLNAIAGIAGVPQISLPCSTASGLPMGFSLIGAAGSDRRLVELAKSARSIPRSA